MRIYTVRISSRRRRTKKLDTVTPLTTKENKFLETLFNRGLLKLSDTDGNTNEEEPMRRRLSSKKSKKASGSDSDSHKSAHKLEHTTFRRSSRKSKKGCKKGKGKGGSTSSSSSSSRSSKKCSEGHYAGQSSSIGQSGPIDLLPITLYFAQQRANAVVVPPGNGTNEISWGSVYTYDGKAFAAAESAPILTDPSGGLLLDYSNYTIQTSDVVGVSTGRCTRIDPNAQTSADFTGNMYCELSYGFDDNGELTYLTAEGVARQESGRHPFAIALAVTGGTGIFRRVIGELSLAPASAPNMSYYIEVIGNLYLDSRVVDEDTYRQIIA